MSFIIPTQTRYIDPYAPLFLNDEVNNEISDATGMNGVSAIVEGVTLQIVNSTSFSVSAGIVALGNIVVNFPSLFDVSLINTSVTNGTTNFVYLGYEYALSSTPNQVYLDVVSTLPTTLPAGSIVILGFLTISSSGSITGIENSYNGYSRTQLYGIPLLNFIQQASYVLTVALNMNNYNIINLASPINPNDTANKTFVDQTISSNNGQVVISSGLSEEYLNTAVIAGQNLAISTNQSTNQLQFQLTTDNLVEVTSADSSKQFWGVK